MNTQEYDIDFDKWEEPVTVTTGITIRKNKHYAQITVTEFNSYSSIGKTYSYDLPQGYNPYGAFATPLYTIGGGASYGYIRVGGGKIEIILSKATQDTKLYGSLLYSLA